MPFVKVKIHAVWGTKSRQPFLLPETRKLVIQHINENAKTKSIYIDTLNGHIDHMHCLFGLNADMSIAKALQLMKGESAHWINKEKITSFHFEWADEYFASSVSDSLVPTIRRYIKNQDEHHHKMTFKEIYDSFIKDTMDERQFRNS